MQFAKAINAKQKSISYYENEESLLTLEILDKIAKVLKKNVGWFLGSDNLRLFF